jgi:hypothetical protein
MRIGPAGEFSASAFPSSSLFYDQIQMGEEIVVSRSHRTHSAHDSPGAHGSQPFRPLHSDPATMMDIEEDGWIGATIELVSKKSGEFQGGVAC